MVVLQVTQDHASACEQVANLLHNPRVSPGDALRLVLLYNLRYESSAGNALREFTDLLHEKGLDSSELSLLKKMTSYGGDLTLILAVLTLFKRCVDAVLTLFQRCF